MTYSAGLIRAQERTMATTVEVPETADNDSPDYRNAAHRAQAEDLLLVRSTYGGTDYARTR